MKVTWARPNGDELGPWQDWPPPLVPDGQVSKHRRHVRSTGIWSKDLTVEALIMTCMGCGAEWHITSDVGCPLYTSQVACENCDFPEPPSWAPKPRSFRPFVQHDVVATLERLGPETQGWQLIGHPANLEQAISMGKENGNGFYVFTVQTGDSRKIKWFGLHNGDFAGINPHGWPKSGPP